MDLYPFWTLPEHGKAQYVIVIRLCLRSKVITPYMEIALHLPSCDLLSATKPFVGCSLNLLQEFITESYQESRVPWKSAQRQSYCTSGRRWISIRKRHVSGPIWVKFGAECWTLASFVKTLSLKGLLYWRRHILRPIWIKFGTGLSTKKSWKTLNVPFFSPFLFSFCFLESQRTERHSLYIYIYIPISVQFRIWYLNVIKLSIREFRVNRRRVGPTFFYRYKRNYPLCVYVILVICIKWVAPCQSVVYVMQDSCHCGDIRRTCSRRTFPMANTEWSNHDFPCRYLVQFTLIRVHIRAVSKRILSVVFLNMLVVLLSSFRSHLAPHKQSTI